MGKEQRIKEIYDKVCKFDSEEKFINSTRESVIAAIETIIRYSDRSLIYGDDLVGFTGEELEKFKEEIIEVLARFGMIKIILTNKEGWTPELDNFLGVLKELYPDQFQVVHKISQKHPLLHEEKENIGVSSFVVGDNKRMRVSFLESHKKNGYVSFNNIKTAKQLVEIFHEEWKKIMK